MKIRNSLFLMLLLTAVKPLFAQTPDTAKLMVHYKFTHVRDTLNKDKPYTENMVLFVGPNASVYKSLDRKTSMANMQADMAKQIKESAGGPQNFNVKMTGNPGTNIEYFYFLNEHKAYRKEPLINAYLIDLPKENQQWKISSDTLTIGGYHCQKATTRFKGRDYAAWFCPDLPFHAGPWKLNGLPGLIVQAADKNNEVVFKLDGIETVDATAYKAQAPTPDAPGIKTITIGGPDNSTPEYLIALPEKGIKSTEKELNRLKEMRDKDPQAFVQSAMAGSGMMVQPGGGSGNISRVQINARPAGSKPVINNPIELADTK